MKHLDEVEQLCRQAGWNQTPADLNRMLNYEPGGCFIASSPTTTQLTSRLVGSVTTTCFGTELAWIGMMLVDEHSRRLGLGTRLMQSALSFLYEKGIKHIALDATPLGQPVYERLGFETRWAFHRWERASVAEEKKTAAKAELADLHTQSESGNVGSGIDHHSRPALDADSVMSSESDPSDEAAHLPINARRLKLLHANTAESEIVDVGPGGTGLAHSSSARPSSSGPSGNPEGARATFTDELLRLDRQAFGADRSEYLQRLASDSSFIASDTGFGMIRDGHVADYLGPVVAENVQSAKELIRSLVSTSKRRLFWDLPGPNIAAAEVARELGFQKVRTLERMTLGGGILPGEPDLQFAFCDPATG